MGGLGEEDSYEGGPRVSISKGWEGWARRRAMKVDLGYQSVRGWEGWARRRAMKVDLGYQSVRGGRVGRGGEL